MKKRDLKIVFFGDNHKCKSSIFDYISKIGNPNGKDVVINTDVNYAEFSIEYNNTSYKFFNNNFSFQSECRELIEKEKKKVSERLIDQGDLILWVIDYRDSFTDYYFSLQRYLEKKNKRYVIIFGNSDVSIDARDDYLNNYYLQRLLKKGKVEKYFVSSLRDKRGVYDLNVFLEKVFGFNKDLIRGSFLHQKHVSDTGFKLTIFGPPNSGKSTLINAILNEERSIVSPIAGTTKEPVVSRWEWKNFTFQLKDTEGVVNDNRNDREILNDCQIAWVVIDATLPITKSTLQIINLAEKCEKAILIVLNKIDLLDKEDIDHLKEEIRFRLKSFAFVPIISISALERRNFSMLFKTLDRVIIESELKFGKSLLASEFEGIIQKNPPSAIRGKRLKIYYAIHEKGLVHKFIIFVNNPNLVHFSYYRYIVNNLRRNLKITSLPIKLIFKKS